MKTFISSKTTLSLIFLSLSATLYADPPTNLARLSFINGTVSFSPAGSKDWAVATLNRPLVNGDRLWDDAGDCNLVTLQFVWVKKLALMP